jgi:hypothetical protein
MRNIFQTMVANSPDKYPKNMGKGWTEKEEELLLELIQQGKTKPEIGTILDRTEGGIRSRLYDIAYRFHHHNKMPISAIKKITGLEHNQIEIVIDKFKKSGKGFIAQPPIVPLLFPDAPTPKLNMLDIFEKGLASGLRVLLMMGNREEEREYYH